jgi:hypothetical protein
LIVVEHISPMMIDVNITITRHKEQKSPIGRNVRVVIALNKAAERWVSRAIMLSLGLMSQSHRLWPQRAVSICTDDDDNKDKTAKTANNNGRTTATAYNHICCRARQSSLEKHCCEVDASISIAQ